MLSAIAMTKRPRAKCALRVLLFIGFVGRGDGAADIEEALVEVSSPHDVATYHLGLFANFSVLPKRPITGHTTITGTANSFGCVPYKFALSGSSEPLISIVRRGTCSFEQKARYAQAAGAAGVVIVNNESYPLRMSGDDEKDQAANIQPLTIFVLSLGSDAGEKLFQEENEQAVSTMATVSVYKLSLWNISEAFLIMLATALVVLGAFFSTSDMREGSPIAPRQEEVLEMSTTEAGSLVVVMSIVLVVLFFFMKYLIYFIIAGFCLGGASCMAEIGAIFLGYHFPSLRKKACSLSWFGIAMSQAELLAAAPAVAIVCEWLLLRNEPQGWIFQDIIGIFFLLLFQRTLRVPNIRVAALLLTCMFFFDIFWVFISPLFFHKSVMVEVAKGGGSHETVPMLLLFPTIGDPVPGRRMLGFGDIAVPGLFLSYLLRYDKQSKRGNNLLSGYFVPAVVGYAVGLSVTIAALCIMGIGQPALLYLVPGTLGTTLVLSKLRGELGCLWNGVPAHLANQAHAAESLATESLE